MWSLPFCMLQDFQDFRFDKNENNLCSAIQTKAYGLQNQIHICICIYSFQIHFAHMIIMFVPVRPPCPACLRVHCLQTKMQIHDRVSGFSRKIEQIIAPAPLVTNPVEKFIFPAKRFHLARRGATCLFKDCRQGKMRQVS